MLIFLNKFFGLVNFKVFGYIKLFKCFVCGYCFNWKWDLNKYMRMKYLNIYVLVIIMDEGEVKVIYYDYMRKLVVVNYCFFIKFEEKWLIVIFEREK